MSIAYLVAQFPKASETFVSREVLALRRLGLEVKTFAFDRPSRAESRQLDPRTRQLSEAVEYLSAGKVARDAINAWRGSGLVWRTNNLMQRVCTCKTNQPLRFFRVLALAHRFRAAGIRHLHAHWPYATQVAYLVHKLTGIPFSVSIHAHEVEYDFGHFPKVFESLSFAIFCNRAAMRRLLGRLPPSARARSHLVYHGVDLLRFPPLPFPTAPEPLRIVSAGRFTRTKGFHRLIRGCARFHQEGGRVELTLLGHGALAGELRDLAENLGFAHHLHLPGWVPHDQVSQCLEPCHLFALLAETHFHDGLPNVVLEAMASARPVLLSSLPAALEAVTPGCEGFVLEAPDDESSVAAVLRQIASRPGSLPAMGRAARRRVERVFDQEIHVGRLKTLMEQATHPAQPQWPSP